MFSSQLNGNKPSRWTDCHRPIRQRSYVKHMSVKALRHRDMSPNPESHEKGNTTTDRSKEFSVMAPARDLENDMEQSKTGHSEGYKLRLAGQDISPELIAISLVYFVQGTLGLSRLALSFFIKDTLHIDPAQSALLSGISSAPWMVKPLYGFLSDSVPLFGYRRRSYLVVCGLLGTVSWAALATVVDGPVAAAAAMVLGSLSTAFSDVVVDSLVVERARGEPQSTSGSLQSLCWGSAAMGGIASAYFSGSLVQDYGTRWVFGLTAMFPLFVSASALLIDEKPVVRGHKDRPQGIQSSLQAMGADALKQARALGSAVAKRHILLPVAFVFLWQATPSAESALFYFQTNQLHFTPEFLGRVRLVASIASLIGVALYNSLLKGVALRRILLWMMILGTVLGSTQLLLVSGANQQLGISNEAFALCDSAVLTTLGQISFMPILVLAARLCPEGVEATLFATLMSILNLGSAAGGLLGAALTQQLGVTGERFDGLFMLVAICSLSTMMPAPFLALLPDDKEEQAAKEEDRRKE